MATVKHELRWALISVGVMLLWMVGERVTGLHSYNIHLQQDVTLFYLVPGAGVFVMALRSFKREKFHGQMTYWQGFTCGLVTTAFITLLSPLTHWVISYIISLDYFRNVIAHTVAVGYYPDKGAAAAHFNFSNYAIQSTIFSAVMGIFSFGVLAIFFRTKNIKT